ncbi:MAG: hypothetical protein EOP48_25780 [Sphingobacteriales bacterium]|nr:MAG: hypothetical protein EOP48_25780 [Sphingobacteriales bacterium]
MRKLTFAKTDESKKASIWVKHIPSFDPQKITAREAISMMMLVLRPSDQDIFYPFIGDLLTEIGLTVRVTRGGDTNNRVDAIVIDQTHSIPIEIKSPTEVEDINIKSIKQALENKIVFLSRKFYPSTRLTTTLAIGYYPPEKRSGVNELIENFFNTYGINVGYIDLQKLLELNWSHSFEGKYFDFTTLINLRGIYQ